MTTWKCLYWRAGCEDVFMADWAIILQRFLYAYVHIKRSGHACIAFHAMKVINAQSFPNSAEVTIWAMINFPVEHLLVHDFTK